MSFVLINRLADAQIMETSTQYLWGDDDLGNSQSIFAEYLRLNLKPAGQNYSVTGYGRAWKDLAGDNNIRDDDALGRLYYLYFDYNPTEKLSFRLGRQWANFTSGSSVMDGITANVSEIGPVGMTFSAGRTVVYSLDSEFSRFGNYFMGFDIHAINLRATQLGVSYTRFYDEWDLAREEVGLNFKHYFSVASPYAEIKYDIISKTFDEATIGMDVYPVNNLAIKAEFYHSYPTFDSTSIYSVFAVDKYSQYLLRAEYSFEKPVSVFVSYAREDFDEGSNADLYTVGTRFRPYEKLAITTSLSSREGYGGHLLGFEVEGDYQVGKQLTASAGLATEGYRRPDQFDYNSASNFWAGANWTIKKNMSVSARLEDQMDENFSYHPMGRLVLNWEM